MSEELLPELGFLDETDALGGSSADSGIHPCAIDTSNEMIRRTLAKLGPALVRPSSLFSLMEADPRDVAKVTASIRHCPVLAARVLGIINSAAFGISRQITSIDRAVALLGPSRARAIALAYGLRLLTDRSGLPKREVDSLWANSIQKAVAAKKFCEVVEPNLADEAYSLGLIQDIGLPMLVAVDPEYYRNHITLLAHKVPWTQHERQRFGFDHCGVGQGLLREWHASRTLQESVLHHHRPPFERLSDDISPLNLAIFFASLLPHMDEESGPDEVEWIHAIHARFLARVYPTPDLFFRAVLAEVRAIRDQDRPIDVTEALLRKLVTHVSSNAISITAKLCRLEQDIDQQKRGINDLKFQAFTDPLTKVLNRRGFTQLAARRLELASAQGTGVCCMLGDLDDFKTVNDNYGHDTGDLLLRGMARVLRKKVNSQDLVGRLGGDEFAILVTGVGRAQAFAQAQKVCDAIEGKAVRLRDDLQITTHFSLGAVFCDTNLDDMNIDHLLTMADQAMYQRKRKGKHGLVFRVFPADDARDVNLSGNPHTITRQAPRQP
ncbi:MAG: diguanylate cyclase [Phycisphaeraceae bacterium]|nr:diguanylate cyclase [Phycisphaeraceae bacterium]